MTQDILDRLAVAYGAALVNDPTEEDCYVIIANAMLAVAQIRKLPCGGEAYARWKARVQLKDRRAAS